MKSFFLLPSGKLMCWWYVWSANYYLSWVFMGFQSLQCPGARYNIEISRQVIEHGLCSSHPSAWPLRLGDFVLLLMLTCRAPEKKWGLCFAVEQPWPVSPARLYLYPWLHLGSPACFPHGGVWPKAVVLWPLALWAEPTKPAQLFSVDCFPKSSKLCQLGELKSIEVLLPSLCRVTEGVPVRQHGKLWSLWRKTLPWNRGLLEPGWH